MKTIRLALCAAVAFGTTMTNAEYVPLPALVSTGRQFIPTDFKLDSRCSVEVKFTTSSKVGTDSANNQCIFCNRETSTKNSFSLFALVGGIPRWDYDTATRNRHQSADKSVTVYTTYIVNVNGSTGTWTVNGVEQGNRQTPAEFTPGGPLTFLASYANGDASEATYSGDPSNYASVTLFYAKIYGSDGTLEHNLVPAEDTAYADPTKRYGLLDTAPAVQRFYANEGSAALVPASCGVEDVYGNVIGYDASGNMAYRFWYASETAEAMSAASSTSAEFVSPDTFEPRYFTMEESDGKCGQQGMYLVIR